MPADSDLQTLEIGAGTYAVHTLSGPYTQINAVLKALYTRWLPHSGYEADDRPIVEHYLNSPRTTAPDALLTDLLIPIRELP
jgi:AraC family transcriptional regulator